MNPTSHRAVVLASGGLDSTVTAALAKQEGLELFFLTIAYGQRHGVEVERARQIAAALGVTNAHTIGKELACVAHQREAHALCQRRWRQAAGGRSGRSVCRRAPVAGWHSAAAALPGAVLPLA